MNGFEGNYDRHLEAAKFFIGAAVDSIRKLNEAHRNGDIVSVMFALSAVITSINNGGLHVRDLFQFHEKEMTEEDKKVLKDWMEYVRTEATPKIEKDLNIVREFLLEMQDRDRKMVGGTTDVIDQILRALLRRKNGSSNGQSTNGKPGNGKPGNGKPSGKKDFSVNEW